ncbi:MAG: hypothetical protein AAFN78_17030 [Pseudomonadota bacterium]
MAQKRLPIALMALLLTLPLLSPGSAQAGVGNLPGKASSSTIVDISTGSVQLSLVDGIWTDRNHTAEHPLLAIRRGSTAFTSLLDLLPALQPVFQLGDHVIVNVGLCSVAVSPRGMEYASPDDLASLLLAGEHSIGTL